MVALMQFDTPDPVLLDLVGQIRSELRRGAMAIIRTGELLTQAKERAVGHFALWVESECGFSMRTAENFMAVYELYRSRPDQDAIIASLLPTVLYRLSAASTPNEAIDEVLGLAAVGQTITVQTTNEVIAAARDAARFVDRYAPPNVRERVQSGDLAVKDAYAITQALNEADEPVRELVETYGVGNANVIPMLQEMRKRGSETYQTLAASGCLQTGDHTIPLSEVTDRDLKAALGEAAFYHRQNGKRERLVDTQATITHAGAGRILLVTDRGNQAEIERLFAAGVKSVRIIIEKAD